MFDKLLTPFIDGVLCIYKVINSEKIMKIVQASNLMFTIEANGKSGDMENVKKVAELFYAEGYDGAEIDDHAAGYVVICTYNQYQGRKEKIDLYKEFKAQVLLDDKQG